MVRSFVVVVAALALQGCYFLLPGGNPLVDKPVTVEEKLIADKPLPASTAAPQSVELFDQVQKLPRGFLYGATRDGKHKLYAAPDVPSEAEPHLVVGALAWQGGSHGQVPDEIRRRALRWGGNSLFCPPNQRFCYVLHLSAAKPDGASPSATGLLRKLRDDHGTYRPDSQPMKLRLAQAETLTFETTPSHCYVVAFALEAGAELTGAATGLYGEVKSGDPLLSNTSLAATEEVKTREGFTLTAPVAGRYIHLRSFAQPIGCAANEGRVTISFQAMGRSNKLGNGLALVQVLARKVSRKELTRKQKEHDQRVEEARRQAEVQRRKEAERRRKEEERRRREAEQRRQEEARRKQHKATTTSSSGGHYSLSLKNNCSRTVRVFIGDKPKFGSGRYTTVSSNSITSYSGFAPQTFWIVDQSDNGLSSWTASAGSHRMQITSSCTGFAGN